MRYLKTLGVILVVNLVLLAALIATGHLVSYLLGWL